MPDKPLTPQEIEANRALLIHVKDWLHYRGSSQRRLADALAVSEPTISKWLRGTQAVTVAQFVAIAKFVDADPAELMSAPPHREAAMRYRRIAEVAQGIPDDAIEEWLALGKKLKRPPSGR